MKNILPVLAFLSLALPCPTLADSDPPRFAIYRVDMPDPDRIPWALTQEYVLESGVRHESPILTEEHILEYCWDDQRLTLTAEGVRRWDGQGGFEVPLTGLPLVVCLDGEPRYAAMLWNPASSMGCRLPEIWCRALGNRLRIGGMFISADGDTTLGPNYDPEVERVMTELGRLADSCPE